MYKICKIVTTNKQNNNSIHQGIIKHVLTHDQGYFWEFQYPQVNESGFFYVFHAHQHFF